MTTRTNKIAAVVGICFLGLAIACGDEETTEELGAAASDSNGNSDQGAIGATPSAATVGEDGARADEVKEEKSSSSSTSSGMTSSGMTSTSSSSGMTSSGTTSTSSSSGMTSTSSSGSGTTSSGTTSSGTTSSGTTSSGTTSSGSSGSTSGMCSVTQAGGNASEAGVIPVCCAPSAPQRAQVDEVFRLLNEHRVANGRAALTYDPNLEAAMQGHCQHMATHGFFSHAAPEPTVSAFTTRATLCGASAAGGENIAFNQQTPAAVMASWTASSGHNANMLNAGYSRVGIGRYGAYWGQIFGR